MMRFRDAERGREKDGKRKSFERKFRGEKKDRYWGTLSRKGPLGP
jgi:hypothetical protein